VIRFGQNQSLASQKTFNLQWLSWALAAGRAVVLTQGHSPVLQLTGSTVQPMSCCLHSG